MGVIGLKHYRYIGGIGLFILFLKTITEDTGQKANMYGSEDLNWTSIEFRLELRRNYFRNQCRRFELDVSGKDVLSRPRPWEYLLHRRLQKPNPSEYIISKNHGLVWCNVFKAASSSWLYNFATLAGVFPKEKSIFHQKTKLLEVVRSIYPRPSLSELLEAIPRSTSFIIVRHPLERLISAYKDKICRPSYPSMIGLTRRIISDYRNVTDKVSLGEQEHPTFPEFIRYLLDIFEREHGINEHWVSINSFCTPCFFDIQFIAHVETLYEDQNYIIRKANLENLIHPEWRNKGAGDTRNEITEYYSQITRKQIMKLYDYYKYDFVLFNYTLDEYLSVAKEDVDDQST